VDGSDPVVNNAFLHVVVRRVLELPLPEVKRWTFGRKAAVVTAVANGEMTFEEACRRYQLSEEELLSWQQGFEAHGPRGLRVRSLQRYRGRRD